MMESGSFPDGRPLPSPRPHFCGDSTGAYMHKDMKGATSNFGKSCKYTSQMSESRYKQTCLRL